MEHGIVANEFACVAVDIDTAANSPRLRLRDLRTGRVRYLDALELETIVWLRDEYLRRLLDPSADRWRDDGAADPDPRPTDPTEISESVPEERP